MIKLLSVADFFIRSLKVKGWELIASLAILILFGLLFDLYTQRAKIFSEHVQNKASIANSIKPLDENDISDYQVLLDWFTSSQKRIPIRASDFIESIKSEAKFLVKVLNDEMVRINEIQRESIQDALRGRPHLSSDREAIAVLTNAYKKHAPDVATSCRRMFEKDSGIKAQALNGDTRKLMNRTNHSGSSRASIDFAIISSHGIPLEEANDISKLKEKWWKFSPVCQLFNTFSSEIQNKIKDQNTQSRSMTYLQHLLHRQHLKSTKMEAWN